MNKLWVFGDSYSTYNRERVPDSDPLSIYTDLSIYLNLHQENKSISGLGNNDILNNLLKFLPEFNSGDYIIFQLSFIDRFSYIDEVKNRKMNLHELDLYTICKRFFLHPQYYYKKIDKLTETQITAFDNFIKHNQSNLIDIYLKFFIQLKHIINFLQTKGIVFKLLLLEDRFFEYNGERLWLIDILKEVDLTHTILTINGSCYITSAPIYREEGHSYEYHHFSLDTIQKYSESLIKNFPNESKI